jgi:hypothetical protein
MDLTASVPSFGAGTSLWALALVLISIPRVFPRGEHTLWHATQRAAWEALHKATD